MAKVRIREVGPERNGDQEQPQRAGLRGPGRDEPGGWKAHQKRDARWSVSDSLTDRQKIVRCASANCRLSSKISFVYNTLRQPSRLNSPVHIAVLPGVKEGIDQHDQQRPHGRGKRQHDQRRGRKRPGIATGLASGRLSSACAHGPQSPRTCTAPGAKRKCPPSRHAPARLSPVALLCSRATTSPPSARFRCTMRIGAEIDPVADRGCDCACLARRAASRTCSGRTVA